MMAMSARADDRRSLGILAISITTVVWGMAGVFVKSTSLEALAFATYRLWLGVAVYVLVLAATRRRLTLATVRACALGGALFAADLGFTFSAFKLTSLANANIIGGLSPIFIAFAASRLFGERFGRREVGLAFVSFGGVALVALGASGTPAWSPAGDLFALCSVASWTAYWLFSKRARRSVPAIEYMASVMLVAAIVMTPIAALSGQSLAPPQGIDWVWIGVVVVFPGAMGHTMIAWAHRHVEAWLGALITQCIPVVAAVAAWVALDEPLTPLVVVGGLVVVAATATLAVGASRRVGREPVVAAVDTRPEV
jgi:drug/metabolite transporter (DMT)-like permease